MIIKRYLTRSILSRRIMEFLSWSKRFMVTSKFIRFWYGRKITKFDFSVFRDNLFAISQLHTMARSSLLIVTSSERKVFSA